MLYRLLRPLLFHLDAERAHELALLSGRLLQGRALTLLRLFYLRRPARDPALAVRCLGLTFPGPVGLAAGVDKNALLVPFWAALGFGFIEVGSVSALPAAGNPRPRAFRLPRDRAIINRMGLPNEGAEAVARRLLQLGAPVGGVPLGVNLVKTPDPTLCGEAAVQDFCAAFRALAGRCSYVTLNVSCPNTEDGKTFTEPAALDGLLTAIHAARREVAPAVPVLLKLPPPASDGASDGPSGFLGEVLDVARRHGVAGLVVCNTASDRQGLTTPQEDLARIGAGGLSGPPLRRRATAMTWHLYRATGGTLPIIGVGGVDSAESAYERIRAGASLVQLYTGMVYEGPGLVRRIHKGLLALLARDGIESVERAVGRDVT
jgi:dihydroorotate dehydrogenase